MFVRILITVGLVSAGLLLILLTTTTPAKTGAFGILAVFLLSYIVTLVVMTFLLWALSGMLKKLTKGFSKSPMRNHAINLKRAYYFSTVLALGPIIIVGLRSVGGVGLYDVGLVAIFMILGCLYISRRTS